MATEKNISSRIINKHDTEINWNKATNFIPKAGEIIVYDRDETYDYGRFKIGDGVTTVTALPFGSIQPDQNQNDETAALEALAECNIITPTYQDGIIYTDANNAIYVL